MHALTRACVLLLFSLFVFLLLKDTGARNERRFAAVFMGKSPGFETLQGLLDHVMKMLEVRHSAGCRVWWWGGG